MPLFPVFKKSAAAYGAQPVIISANLRRHPARHRVNSARCHGGALAALEHLLSEEIGRLVIPSSYLYHDRKPRDALCDLDPLWSSSRLEVQHSDASLQRNGKIPEVAKNALAMKDLRVCWEKNAPTGNCSNCEKHVRTRLVVAICDRLKDCETFDKTRSIKARLDRLPVVSPHLLSIYEELRRSITNEQVRLAVDRLISRSDGYPGRIRYFVQRLRRALGFG